MTLIISDVSITTSKTEEQLNIPFRVKMKKKAGTSRRKLLKYVCLIFKLGNPLKQGHHELEAKVLKYSC